MRLSADGRMGGEEVREIAGVLVVGHLPADVPGKHAEDLFGDEDWTRPGDRATEVAESENRVVKGDKWRMTY